MINARFGAQIVTPWTVGRLPADDIDELLYWIDTENRWKRAQDRDK